MFFFKPRILTISITQNGTEYVYIYSISLIFILFAVPSGLLSLNSMCLACECNNLRLQVCKINFILYILALRVKIPHPLYPQQIKIKYKVKICSLFIKTGQFLHSQHIHEEEYILA